MVVTVEYLDANFEISFVEGGRTPLSDAAMQQNLVALMQPYMALWDSASKGGPQGVIAKNYMQVLADRFDLPKDLHPDELKAELEEQEAEDKKSKKSKKSKEKPQEPPEQAAAAGPPPEQQAPGESPEAPPPPEGQAQAEDVLAQIAQMPPDQAIEALRQLFADQPELIQVIDQISAMPPDKQSAAIQQVLEAASANI